MYKVHVEEFEGMGWLKYANGVLFYKTSNNLYKKELDTWLILYGPIKSSEEMFLSFFAENFWLYQETEQGNTYTSLRFGEERKRPYQLPNCSFLSDSLLFDRANKRYIGVGDYNKSEGLLLGDLHANKPSEFIAGDFSSDVIQYGDYFIVRGLDDDASLTCFDQNLKSVWQTPLKYSGAGMRGLPCYPEIYQDIIYLNMPENAWYQKTPTPMDIGAFCANTGKPLWLDTLPCCARNADLHGGEVYIASDYFLQIRDVKTGEVVWELPPFWLEDEVPCHLYPLNEQDLLVNFQFKNKALIINRRDKSITQTITFPEKSYYCFSTTSLPIKISDTRWVWELVHTHFTQNARNSGVVFIDVDNNQAKEVEAIIKPRPTHKLKGKTVDVNSGEKEYFLEIDHSNIEEIIRYAIIIIQNFAYDKGSLYPPLKPDRKHNGKIHVSVVKKSLITDKTDNEIQKAFTVIKEIVEYNLQDSSIRAGNKKDEFSIDIQLI